MLHRGSAGDIDFYRRVCAETRDVLELGCGDGRVSLPVARDGAFVTGIERHPDMLAAAMADREGAPTEVQARLRYVSGDISDFELHQEFQRVIAPYTTVYALSPEARQDCFRCVRRHLAPNGLFVFDVYPAEWILEEGSYADPEPLLIARLVNGEEDIDVYEQDVHDAELQRVSVTYLHEIRVDDLVRTTSYTIEHHYLLLQQIEPALQAEGLALVSVAGDFHGGPFEESAARLVVTAAVCP